jgi:6-pyruvoyltetrahydropterin/6-carboxytetrahydropterin synthase
MADQIAVYDSFPAAHRIRIDTAGTREPVHVHHWRAKVEFRAPSEPLAAASRAAEWLERWVERHRGRSLNDVPPYGTVNPTAEEVARHLADEFRTTFPETHLIAVTIGEAAGFSARYCPARPAGNEH